MNIQCQNKIAGQLCGTIFRDDGTCPRCVPSADAVYPDPVTGAPPAAFYATPPPDDDFDDEIMDALHEIADGLAKRDEEITLKLREIRELLLPKPLEPPTPPEPV